MSLNPLCGGNSLHWQKVERSLGSGISTPWPNESPNEKFLEVTSFGWCVPWTMLLMDESYGDTLSQGHILQGRLKLLFGYTWSGWGWIDIAANIFDKRNLRITVFTHQQADIIRGLLKGPKLEIFGYRVFTQIRPVCAGDAVTRQLKIMIF